MKPACLVRKSLAVVIALLAISFSPAVLAGTISGTVVDANTGAYLPSVTITMVETGRVTTATREGRFTFSNVSPGTYTLRADYVGFPSESQTVSVSDVGISSVRLTLGGETLLLDALVVTGAREGRARALQQKREAPNVMEIVSADSAGSLPDRNVADALARVPGLSLTPSAGEGQFVTIRGIEPNLNNVTINGATMAPPSVAGRSGRAVPLDMISASQISQIEVIKSLTPDMDANALAGTINIKTVSAFDRENRFIFGAIEAGRNRMIGEPIYGADFTYGDIFGARRNIGLAVALSYSDRDYANDQIEGEWGVAAGQTFLNKFTMGEIRGNRERRGLNVNLEVRPDADTEFYVRSLFNRFTEKEEVQQLDLELRRAPTFVGPRSVAVDRVRVDSGNERSRTEQELLNLTVGGSKRVKNLTYSGDVTYSFAEEDMVFGDTVQFRGDLNFPANNLFTFDYSNYVPRYSDGGLIRANYQDIGLRRLRLESSAMEETTWAARFDVKYDFDGLMGGRSGFFKAGVRYTDRKRFVDDTSDRYVNPSITAGMMNSNGPARFLYDDKVNMVISHNLDNALAWFRQNQAQLNYDLEASLSNSVEDDFNIREKILGLYGMASVDVNSRLTVFGGLRYERTDAVNNANLFNRGTSPPTVVPRRGTFDYDNYLPNLQARLRINDRSVVRAAITGSIGRPAYQDASPISRLDMSVLNNPANPAFPNEGTLRTGNAELDPFEAINLDLSYEYYLRSGGLISIGGFHKRIDNPIFGFSEVRRNTTFSNMGFETLNVTETRNADSGRVSGVEFALQLPFAAFTRGVLDGFGVDFNATLIGSRVKVFGRESEKLPFFRQPDEIVNVGLYYQKYGLTARVAYNHQSENLRILGGNSANDVYYSDRQTYDAQVGYRFNERYEIYANWQNITNAPVEQWIGDRSQLYRPNMFGSNLRVGLRFSF